MHPCTDWQTEREPIAAHIRAWDANPDERIAHEQIAICVPTNLMASELGSTLGAHGVRALEIGADGARGEPRVHIGTMFRFKGLEYQRMIIAGASDGLVPREQVNQLRQVDPARYRRSSSERNPCCSWRRPGHATASTSSGMASRARSCTVCRERHAGAAYRPFPRQPQAAADEPSCTPGSVPRDLAVVGATAIHLGPALPPASCGLPADSGGQPSIVRAGAPRCSLLTLLRVGFT